VSISFASFVSFVSVLLHTTLAQMERYRGRFAPTPSGPLHFGSLVAAVGSYLEARHRGGEWLVRIDDLDPPRVVPGAADGILRTLAACGFSWDGGIVRQSRRSEAYHAALHQLRRDHRLYPCACSRRDIAESALAGAEGPVYPGTCRDGLTGERPARALRLDTRGGGISFEDALQGRITQNVAADVGDFVLYRADRVFSYHLAVAVDDAEQGITDVVRGADLLPSTARQILLQRLLGLPTPRYAHLPIAVDRRGDKLAKQTQAAPVNARNPLPALVEALQFLGHPPPLAAADGRIEELWRWAMREWRLERVPRERTRRAPEN
jgi:glutamyl-Q tRNA(Asp) synthetase